MTYKLVKRIQQLLKLVDKYLSHPLCAGNKRQLTFWNDFLAIEVILQGLHTQIDSQNHSFC